tara:strand:+ start:204679 stop:205602 length:924 start_codon:yes stop_codon:yes gene_type:complete
MPLNPAIKRLLRIAYKNNFDQLHTFSIEMMRSYLNHPVIRTSEAPFIDITVNPEVHARCFTPINTDPEQELPAIFFISGTAFIMSRLDPCNQYCSLIANQSNMKVINIAHRLAPEHKYPKYLYDCIDTIHHVRERAAQYKIDPNKLAIWGESSGGTIAASCTHKLKSASDPILKHQTLFYPMLDFINKSPSKKAYGQGYMLDDTFIDWLDERGFEPEEDRSHPLISPLLSDSFDNLCPATIITAEYDPLRDEGEAYGKKLAAANVPIFHQRFDGMIHGFMRFYNNITIPKQAMALACEQVRIGLGHT